MSTKKKAVQKGKAKKVVAKKTAKSAKKATVTSKSKAKPISKTAKPVKKIRKNVEPKTKKTISKKKQVAHEKPVETPVITHGVDLDLIPVTGNIHPARINEARRNEFNFKHKEETALHQEQQRIKTSMANRQNIQRKFLRPRQS